MGDRNELTKFWSQYAHSPTIETMMLNKNAHTFDDKDRNDVLSGLPDLTDMRIVELGAGIGRFTKYLAPNAKSVFVTDIIQSFVEKNKKLHDHHGNCTFQTLPASEIVLEPNSSDLVFTNWLMMYLTDNEVVQFFQNVLRWLTDDGYMHFRESCSESSKRTSVSETEVNPTHYRHICQYINLFNAITLIDPSHNNKRYGFKILWAKSIPTYIEAANNWRQIQMLIRKVEISRDAPLNNVDRLLDILKDDTLKEQQKFDKNFHTGHHLWNGRTPVSKFLLKSFQHKNGHVVDGEGVLNIVADSNFCLSPFEIVEEIDCCAVGVETCAYAYNNLLAEAVNKCDKRVRLHWLKALDSYDEWQLQAVCFDCVIGCRLTKSVSKCDQLLNNIKVYLKPQGHLILLEELDEGQSLTENLEKAGFKKIEETDVTNEIKALLLKGSTLGSESLPRQSSLYEEIAQAPTKWCLINASN